MTLGNFWLVHHHYRCFDDRVDHVQCLASVGHFGLIAFGKLVCTTEVAVGMEQLPGMWGTRQEKCSSCVMLTGIKHKGTCRSSGYLFVFRWQPACRFKYGSTASTMEVHRKRQPRSQPVQEAARGRKHSPKERAISCLTAELCPARPACLSQQLGCVRTDWKQSPQDGVGLPSRSLRHPKKQQTVQCFAGPVGSAFKWEVLEHEEKFSVKWSVLKTSVYYCLFWMQYSTPKAPWESEGTVCRAKRCSIPLFADIGKIRLFLLPCEQSN